ncbi:MAG: CpsD/CapB family tyrosine-protein kinase [Syntrophobacteraceae bacterium]|jgi:capsular exopolysaccharide synthesis family protein
MSKIYEALQHAHMEKESKVSATASAPIPLHVLVTPDKELEEEMLSLYKILDTLLPHSQCKILQFIGSHEGEGASTIIREFAIVSANLIGHSVLLLDADRYNPTQGRFFELQHPYCWIDALKDGAQIGKAIHQIGTSSLFMSPSCNSSAATPEIFNSPTFSGFCQSLRADFDLVLIDSAPLTISADGLAVASKVDGVILVVEAERTRWQTVRKVRDSICRVGGNILGVVLNKRRYYIPQSIYKHL